MSGSLGSLPRPLRLLAQSLACWGVWPALVMAAAYLEAAWVTGSRIRAGLLPVVVAGTLAVYGADRWGERRRFAFTESRHHAPAAAHTVFMLIIAGLFAYGLPLLRLADWLWLAVLGLAGFCYLLLTLGLAAAPPLLKEILGAYCFTFLIWGGFRDAPDTHVAAFFAMGTANFLWAGYQDRARDRDNGLMGWSVMVPHAEVRPARLAALLAAWGFWQAGSAASPLFWTALLHALWPQRDDVPIDLAFLPLMFSLLPRGA